ncbi:hypothetical protein F5X98DRAFT_373777 [Xylaria grammica]|nr:hypothetical protein F5X98DRAFT_373777 [Xylaria grammica]
MATLCDILVGIFVSSFLHYKFRNQPNNAQLRYRAVVRLILPHKNLHTITANRGLIYLQDTIFIFKDIEPNASIVAACLPTYGPLIKGWSAPRFISLNKTKPNDRESQTELNGLGNSNHIARPQEPYRPTENSFDLE